MKILTCGQMRNLEQSAAEHGTGYYELMQNAGIAAAKAFIRQFGIKRGDKVVSVCGKGNNGGDGIVAAAYFNEIGIAADIILTDGEIKTNEAAEALKEAAKLNVPIYRLWLDQNRAEKKIKNADYIIDAIYGIGFKGAIKSNIQPIIELINSSCAQVMSMDLPSGIVCDSGKIENGCVRADFTVSFTALKPLHVLYPSMDYCGKTKVLNVGISQRLINSSPYWLETTDRSSARKAIAKRTVSSNKGTFGTVLSVCGSYGMAGAAQLAARGAYSCGAGLVKNAVTHSVYTLNAPAFPEPVYIPLNENKNGRISAENTETLLKQCGSSTALLIGCGIGVDDDTRKLVAAIIAGCEVPMVIDADALNIIAECPEILKHAKAPVIITPHPGEMSRLCGISVKQVQYNRKGCAEFFAEKYNVITVLKGAYTVIASGDGKCVINTTGNPGMAKGGSGDVLAGITAGLLAQGAAPFDAACAGAYIHGGAGDICCGKLGEYSMTASDLIACVPEFLMKTL